MLLPQHSTLLVGNPNNDDRRITPAAEMYLMHQCLHTTTSKKTILEGVYEVNRQSGGGLRAFQGWNARSLSNVVRNFTSLFYARSSDQASRYPKAIWITLMEQQGC